MKTTRRKNKRRVGIEEKRNKPRTGNFSETPVKPNDKKLKQKRHRKSKEEEQPETSLKQQRKLNNRKSGQKGNDSRIKTKKEEKGKGHKVAKFKKNNTRVEYVSIRGKRKASKPKAERKTLPNTSKEEIGDMICTTTQIEESVENSDQYILSPLTSVWLGAAMNLDDLNKGIYSNNTEKRYSITISNDFGYNGDNSKVVKNPRRHTVRDASVELKDQYIIENPGTQVAYDLFEVHSAEQLKLRFGAEAQFGAANISGSTNFNFKSTSNNYMAVFKQVFYNEYVSNMSSDRFFKDRVATENDIYVSSISYGRMVLLSIESTSTKQEIDAMLSVSYLNAKASLNAEYEKTLASSKIKLFIQGGGSKAAGTLISDLTQLSNYIKNNSEYNCLNNPGSPIAYRFTSAGTGALVNVISSTSFPKQECVPYTGKYEVKIISIKVEEKNKSKNLKIHGSVSVKGYTKTNGSSSGKYKTPDGGAVVWNRNKNNVLKLGQGKEASVDAKRIVCFNKLTEIDQNNSYIEIKVDISEKDALKGKKSQKLGVKTKEIRLHELPEYIGIKNNSSKNFVEIRDGKGIIKVNFSIKSLNTYG